MRSTMLLACTCALTVGALIQTASGQTRQEKVLGDFHRVTAEGFWIYNDLDAGMLAAAESGKPILVTLRCIPCEECVKLDEELIEGDPDTERLLNEFVRVRLVATNGLDLSLFQYDYDQSFTMLMMNADGTIYGRYGTRSDRVEWKDDVSVAGLAAALQATLELHKDFPDNRPLLAGKQGRRPLFSTPNDAPSFRGRFPRELEFDANVVKNCIHCHMIGDAERELFRSRDEAIPDQILFSHPHPKTVGLIIDPQTAATVREVKPDSPAAAAGFRTGDQIKTAAGQAILSMADLQWVFHHSADEDRVEFTLLRDGRERDLEMTLPEGWRRWGDLSWRSTSWPLRRMATGGLVMEAADDQLRRELEMEPNQMALLVTHVGQYNEHAVAKRAGFRNGDVIISYAGRADLMRETDLIAHGVQELSAGSEIPVVVLRDGRRREFKLLMQE